MEFRRVVIGVDFTDASLAAARWAAMQFAPRAEIVLAHALPDPDAPPYLRPFVPSEAALCSSLAPVFYGGLQGLARLIDAERARVHMAAGAAADVLAAAAQQLGADLVCVGRGARRRGGARFGATTALRTTSRARVPVMVVPARGHDVPGRIVAAVGDGPSAARVLGVACGLAAAHEARVDAVHVVGANVRELVRRTGEVACGAGETPPWASRALPDADDGARAAWLRARAREWLEHQLAQVGAAPGRARAVVASGDAGQEIVAHLAYGDAGLVVVGRGDDQGDASRRAGEPAHVGSTARLVAWAAPCPALVIPPGWSPPPHRASDEDAAGVGHTSAAVALHRVASDAWSHDARRREAPERGDAA